MSKYSINFTKMLKLQNKETEIYLLLEVQIIKD